ncbi:MAG: monovalent cation/H(+) antiporter subunit G, partial [Candidatus Omnitrophica bacterium]|nr:monovalent cation/H(+) antiporter subunit G [Candidatus Omnitrophota bacterium]
MRTMIETFGTLFLCIGLFFVFSGSLGVTRFEDVYLRLQASSKSITLGLSFFLGGVAILFNQGEVTAKVVLAILFQFLTAPIAAQTIARVALLRGQKPEKMTQALGPAEPASNDGAQQ